MKQKSLILLVSIVTTILLLIPLQGCIDQNNSNHSDSILVTASLKTLVLKLDELPDNVIILEEYYNDTEQNEPWPNITAICTEKFTVDYHMNDTNLSYFLLLELRKIESTKATEDSFNAQESTLLDTPIEIIPVEKIGDETILGKIETMYHLIFRKYNVITVITSAVDSGLEEQDIIDYAKIIENNIESSIES